MVDPRQLAYLDAMGIDVWVRRQRTQTEVRSLPETEIVTSPQSMPPTRQHIRRNPDPQDERTPMSSNLRPEVETMDWPELQETVAACTRCGLHQARRQTVFGVGNVNADWLLIGEAPGAEEDRHGEPFVGRAGQLLNAMLQAIGLNREDVYIANILKCRPPRNRDPKPEEVACCQPYLKRQIVQIQPKIILALGRIAAQNLLNTTTPIGRMRGKRYCYSEMEIPIVVTYHPAYLLRSPTEKKKVWQDLQLAQRVLT